MPWAVEGPHGGLRRADPAGVCEWKVLDPEPGMVAEGVLTSGRTGYK